MTFLAPWWLAAGGVAGAAVVALHFLARQRPRAANLPTARFVPDLPARAPSRAVRPADLVLMAVRVAAVLALSAAMAGPVPGRSGYLPRVVLADVSRAAASLGAVRDSAAAAWRDGDVLIAFDSAARHVTPSGFDSIVERETGRRPKGSLSAALAAARRAASRLGERYDSVELVIVSPLLAEEWDAATAAIRAEWPGRARLVRIGAADRLPAQAVAVYSEPDDPMRATVALLGRRTGPATRLVRGVPAGADSAWAAGGGVLVVWPREPLLPAEAAPAWRGPGAVFAEDVVSVAAYPRAPAAAIGGTVVARWADGAPAATERPLGSGCVRQVAVPFIEGGDYALRGSTLKLVDLLAAPCGGTSGAVALGDSALGLLRGPDGLAAGSALSGGGRRAESAPALVIVCLMLLGIEAWLRSRAR
jgi:hypothetical protein